MWIHAAILLIAYWGVNWYKSQGSQQFIDRQRKNYIILMMFLLALQSGFRNVGVGADTYQYYLMFKEASETSWNEIISNVVDFLSGDKTLKDPIYVLVEKIFYTIIPSFRMFLIVISIAFFTALGRIYYQYMSTLKEVMVSIALYMCLYYSFFSVTGLRQTIASTFLLLAVPYAIRKKPLKFFFFIAIAATQHKSALLFSVFYLFPLFNLKRKALLLAFALYVPMVALGGTFAKVLIMGTIFDQYAGFLDGYEKAGAYMFAFYILVLGVCLLWKYKIICNNNPNAYIFINALSLAIILTPLTMINPSNMRVIQYFSVFGLILLPKFCTAFSKTDKSVDIGKLIFIFLALYTLYRGGEYKFFWQDMYMNSVHGNFIINDSLLN